MMQKNIRELETKIKENYEKIKEYKDICFNYSHAVYEFLGAMSEESISKLNPFEQIALNKLKEDIDRHISSENYKECLKRKYIDKNVPYNYVVGLADIFIEKYEKRFNENILKENFPEDNTETLKIIEHKDIKEGH